MVTEDSVMLVIRVSRPNFRNNHDKLAFAVHSSFLAAGFVLVATGTPAFAANPLSSSSLNDEVGIDEWNKAEDRYAFVYKNPKNGNKKVLVKCLVMGDKLMVDALSDGGSEPVFLEISVDDYVTETEASDYSAQYKNVGKLVSSLESNVISKVDGSSAGGSATAASRSSADEDANRYRSSADEEANRYPGSNRSQDPHTGFVVPPVSPFGGSDLYPGPGAGMYPSRGDFGGGSMLIGPEDPRWLGDRGGFPGMSGGPGGLGIPPGARYDPIGPPGVPGFEPDRFGRFPRGPNPGRGGRRGGIHPDIEQPGSGGFDDYI